MFALKKYKIVKEFNGYRAGITVAFNGADAQKYAEFIVPVVKVSPVIAEPVVEEKQEEKSVKKTVKKVVKKGRK